MAGASLLVRGAVRGDIQVHFPLPASATLPLVRDTASGPDASAEDRPLVAAMRGGDERALSALYDRHAPALLGLVMRFVQDQSDAEAVLLKAFLQAWRSAESFDAERGSVLGWLTIIARSRALDFVRTAALRQRREPLNEDRESPLMLVDDSAHADPSAAVEAQETRRTVEAALASLQPAQRVAIELAYFEGLTHVEVAERLAEPLGTIKTRIRMGMIKLRELLAPLAGEVGR